MPVRQNLNPWSWHSEHCFLSYLLSDKAILLSSLPSDHIRGFSASSPMPSLCPAPEVTPPASCVQLYSKLNLNATCSLKPSLTTKSHSVISLLSSSLGSPRTCLLNWTLTHKNIVFSSHLRLITCFSHQSCMLVGPYHLLNKQINRWNTLAYSCHWFFKWLALKCILQISGWH